jgi:hypothetical protein
LRDVRENKQIDERYAAIETGDGGRIAFLDALTNMEAPAFLPSLRFCS